MQRKIRQFEAPRFRENPGKYFAMPKNYKGKKIKPKKAMRNPNLGGKSRTSIGKVL